jgi:predicted Zn-dependent peptidase
MRAVRVAIIVCILALAVSLTSPALATPPLHLPVETHQLANGLHVVFAPDPSLPDATVMVRYGVGSSDDPKGEEGLAHLIEHLMFSGSKHVAHDEFLLRMLRAGATNLNAMTTLDDTRYVETVTAEQLPLVFWLESDRLGFAAGKFDQASIDRERALIADEIRSKTYDTVLASVGGAVRGQLFPPWHPYRRGLEATALGKVTLADVRAFMSAWYTPSNVTLIVAGHFDPAATLALADRYFGDLPGPAAPARPPLPAWQAPDSRLEMAAGVSRDVVQVLWRAPPLGQPDDLALDLASLVLADPGGRLQRALVSRGLAVRVTAQEQSQERASVFAIAALVADGADPERVADTIEAVVADLAGSLTADECDRARAEATDADLLHLETSAGRASWIVTHPGRPLGESVHQAVQLADVQRAVRAALLPHNRAVVVVRRDGRAPARGVVRWEQEVPR